MALIRKSREADCAAMLAIVNDAARAYRGVIPADQWREPYMPADELEEQIADGVMFWVAEEDGRLLGMMGLQDKGEVALVRHAYVTPTVQRKGVGTRLLRHVQGLTRKPVLIGTAVVGATTMIFSIIMVLTDGLRANMQYLTILHAPFLLGLITGGAVIYWFTGASTQAVTSASVSD